MAYVAQKGGEKTGVTSPKAAVTKGPNPKKQSKDSTTNSAKISVSPFYIKK